MLAEEFRAPLFELTMRLLCFLGIPGNFVKGLLIDFPMHFQLLANVAPHPGNGDEYSDGLLKEGCENGGGLKRIKQEKKEPFFSDAQFSDFCNQILVHNCIADGLRVPFHLLLPIWMSVYDSFGPDIYKNYPSFIGFNPQNCDHSIMTEPDLERCRRTDGRKWRCRKSVVTNQKYCERHMHRGSQRSRKHVETIETVLKPDEQKLSDADDDNRVPMTSNVDYGIVVCLSTLGNEASNNINIESKKSSFEDPNHRIISNRNHGVVKNSVCPTSSGFGLSPKSVLHGGAGQVSPNLESKKILEDGPQRCLRTDGKKWQCKRDALPNQKYCDVHLHRGAKRVIPNSESVGNIPATFAGRAWNSSRSPENSINLNTMPSSPQHVGGNNSASSTSDAITVTDENISFCIAQSFHNC